MTFLHAVAVSINCSGSSASWLSASASRASQCCFAANAGVMISCTNALAASSHIGQDLSVKPAVLQYASR